VPSKILKLYALGCCRCCCCSIVDIASSPSFNVVVASLTTPPLPSSPLPSSSSSRSLQKIDPACVEGVPVGDVTIPLPPYLSFFLILLLLSFFFVSFFSYQQQ